ncbi:Intestine-specific homeobox [Lemmus lemmus]
MIHGDMEKESSGYNEAREKLGLSFSIDAILRRPSERRNTARPQSVGEEDSRQTATPGSKLEKPPQDQSQGSCADTHCSAHAGASHGLLPMLSDSAHFSLVPCPDHPCPMAHMGSAALVWLSYPTSLCSYPRPATSIPQVGQHLCHFNIGTLLSQ